MQRIISLLVIIFTFSTTSSAATVASADGSQTTLTSDRDTNQLFGLNHLNGGLSAPATPRRLPRRRASSTAYCPSEDGQVMADGSSGHWGVVAVQPGYLRLGTRIRMLRPRRIRGKRIFRVRDHIGWGSELDIWMPNCSLANNWWGRRQVTFEILPRH